MHDDKWFDKFDLVHVDESKDSENGILFTAEYWTLRNMISPLTDSEKKHIDRIIRHHFRTDNKGRTYFTKNPNSDGTHFSHDNKTAMTCLSKLAGLDYHKKVYWGDFYYNWTDRLHPRDIIFYNYTKGGIRMLLAAPFMFIHMIIMVISCIQDYKIRGENKILKTDGKLLAWLKINTFCLPVTKFFCNLAIRHNKEFKNWVNIFAIYFKRNDHPNNIAARNVYGED